jgi:4-hydroxy-3-methylbut-2-enyl diphosphate reductase
LIEPIAPTFFISNEKAILNVSEIQHFNLHAGQLEVSPTPWASADSDHVPTVLLTSGASCPDATVERVMERILSFYPGAKSADEVWAQGAWA